MIKKAYWCPTEKQAKKLLKELGRKGYSWRGGEDISDTLWYVYESETVYLLSNVYHDLTFANRDYCYKTHCIFEEYVPENTIYGLLRKREMS